MGCLYKLRRFPAALLAFLVDSWEWLVEFWATLSAAGGPVVADSYEAALKTRSVVKRREAILLKDFLGHRIDNPEDYWYEGYLNGERVYRNPFLRAYSREKPPKCRELWSADERNPAVDKWHRRRGKHVRTTVWWRSQHLSS
jgi:hypothetical protein